MLTQDTVRITACNMRTDIRNRTSQQSPAPFHKISADPAKKSGPSTSIYIFVPPFFEFRMHFLNAHAFSSLSIEQTLKKRELH